MRVFAEKIGFNNLFKTLDSSNKINAFGSRFAKIQVRVKSHTNGFVRIQYGMLTHPLCLNTYSPLLVCSPMHSNQSRYIRAHMHATYTRSLSFTYTSRCLAHTQTSLSCTLASTHARTYANVNSCQIAALNVDYIYRVHLLKVWSLQPHFCETSTRTAAGAFWQLRQTKTMTPTIYSKILACTMEMMGALAACHLPQWWQTCANSRRSFSRTLLWPRIHPTA